MMLNVAAWERRSVVNGPGERFVLWVQGCPFRCPGCYNPAYLPRAGGTPLSAPAVAGLVLATSGIEGVTYTGGEPMAQARGLSEVSRRVRAAGLSVFCFSGYTLEELRRSRSRSVHELLGELDVLVDGRYEAEHSGALPWRGSANQRVHFLTDRYRHLAASLQRPGRSVEFIVGRDGFVTTGVFDEAFIERLTRVMAARGAGAGEPLSDLVEDEP